MKKTDGQNVYLGGYDPFKASSFPKSESLEKAYDSIYAQRLTPYELDLMTEWVDTPPRMEFAAYGKKTTTCILKLKSGFEIVGSSGCEDPSKWDAAMGRTYALKDALRKLGEFAAFYRAQMRIMETKVLKVDTQLSPFEIEELRKMLSNAASGHGRLIPGVFEPRAMPTTDKSDN